MKDIKQALKDIKFTTLMSMPNGYAYGGDIRMMDNVALRMPEVKNIPVKDRIYVRFEEPVAKPIVMLDK
jgi:hypothetical protein